MPLVRRRNGKPRILMVTPEITYLPAGMGNLAHNANAKAGGLADVSASLVAALFELGADVHVALPHYRRMFHMDVGRLISDELRVYKNRLPDARIHLAEDRCFYYRDAVYSNYEEENPRLALAFQREIVNHILPTVDPDLVHCNDWMTGLIPAAARRLGIPSLFTLHNIHTQDVTLARIEDAGIDAAEFWPSLYFNRMPRNYEETRGGNPVDMLVSGVFAAHFINTVSPTFLAEITRGCHSFVPDNLRMEIIGKQRAGCAEGILNAPDPSYDPATDMALESRYGPDNAAAAKRDNKLAFQRKVGLDPDGDAPLLFWPSRLDPQQKGPQLLTDILNRLLGAYAGDRLQVAVVANGAHQHHFHDILRWHELYGRLAVCDFEESLSRLGYAASDFTLMPSRFEPCGLPQMIGAIYGSLPVAFDTGGLHDTVSHLDVGAQSGNGFLFQHHTSAGLEWAIGEALRFWRLPSDTRAAQVTRVMRESKARFNHHVCAQSYIDLYERMLQRDLVAPF
ncbi:MAG: glycogen/starch synthase [Kiritimatiellae bacterium]|nr:glycogen/starch synthase [Kiritimatiellia bacterium]